MVVALCVGASRRGQNDGLARKRHRCARETELAARAIPACEQAQIIRAGINVRGDGYIIRRAKLQKAHARWRIFCFIAGQRDVAACQE